MKKETLIGVVASIVIVGGIVFYAAMKPSPAKAPGAAAPALGETSYIEHAPYYDIAVNYASSTPLRADVGASEDAAAVALMKQFVSDTVAQFKTDGNFANLTPEDVKTMGLSQSHKETLEIKYLISSSPRTVSYIFTTYEDTLGAHGNMFFHTFTFDTSTGAPLALADIFAPGSSYLDTLSSISRAKLPAIIGDGANASMLESGTTPDAKNFSSFFLDNNQLVLLFDPYQVAPYTAGAQTLRIPLSELSGILQPAYRQ
ncbi:MAG: RsiV family protein [Minisyncoccota bacterium]